MNELKPYYYWIFQLFWNDLVEITCDLWKIRSRSHSTIQCSVIFFLFQKYVSKWNFFALFLSKHFRYLKKLYSWFSKQKQACQTTLYLKQKKSRLRDKCGENNFNITEHKSMKLKHYSKFCPQVRSWWWWKGGGG